MNKHIKGGDPLDDVQTTAKNVLGGPLQVCSYKPLTGFFRDGCCQSSKSDHGQHLICGIVTREFLQFSKSKGNDLITPRPEFNFPGLKPGDKWCLCVDRWYEAYKAGCPPSVVLEATHGDVLTEMAPEVLTAITRTTASSFANDMQAPLE